jgi:hypothetical protein
VRWRIKDSKSHHPHATPLAGIFDSHQPEAIPKAYDRLMSKLPDASHPVQTGTPAGEVEHVPRLRRDAA